MKARRTVVLVIATAFVAAGALAQQPAQDSGSQGPHAPGAGVGMTLGSDSGTFTVVTKQPDGTLVETCVKGSQNAADLVSTGAGPAKTAEGGALDVR